METMPAFGIFLHQDSLVIDKQTQQFILPLKALSHLHDITHPDHSVSLGLYNGQPVYGVYVESEHLVYLPEKLTLMTARDILVTVADVSLANLLCAAKQLLYWHRKHRYCGYCGQRTVANIDEDHCKHCDACSSVYFPTVSPAIIVLIHRGDDILLARSPHFAENLYSTLAGFINAGETCEAAVAREVYEEVGIEIENIRYFGSQSWPFPNSFMLGFIADYKTGELNLHPKEIEDAQWFNHHNLPLIPPPYSIARQMIDSYIAKFI